MARGPGYWSTWSPFCCSLALCHARQRSARQSSPIESKTLLLPTAFAAMDHTLTYTQLRHANGRAVPTWAAPLCLRRWLGR